MRPVAPDATTRGDVTLFLSGDVMTGRAIDQVLPVPSDPVLYEPWVRNALDYVELAERASGRIPDAVEPSYIWGHALRALDAAGPHARIINLETAVTTSDEPDPKGINYRMHPSNTPCLTAAGIDCCVLANNHVMDWGRSGLLETLATLRSSGMCTAGAGRTIAEARAPAILEGDHRRILVFAYATQSSGVPARWAASESASGVSLLPHPSRGSADRVAEDVRVAYQEGDVVVVSVHWGGNWGYDIPRGHRAFAHRLLDSAPVSVIHGHSSHHPKGIEVYREAPILYGCGDLLNDYEGITGHEEYRGDLVLLYLVTLGASGLAGLRLVPLRIRRFRLERASEADTESLLATLRRECAVLGTDVRLSADGSLDLVRL